MIVQELTSRIRAVTGVETPFTVEVTGGDRGDYATNIAMIQAKAAGQNPRALAEEIAGKLVDGAFIVRAEVAGPGFINMHLADSVLIEAARTAEKLPQQEAQRIVVEYGQENIAKPLSVGHLIGNILGQAVVNVLKALGHTVSSDNHLGDYGTQFGKVITAYRLWGNEEKVRESPIEELVALYVRFHEEAEKDPALDDTARAESKKLEDKDPENVRLWTWFREESIRNLDKVHERLGVHFDEMHGEAFYTDMLPRIVQEMLDKGVAIQGEGNSVIVPSDKYEAPLLIRRGDGGTVYATRDLATVEFYVEHYKPDIVLQLVGSEQSQYFEQMYDAARRAGMMGGSTFIHVKNGLVSLPDGKMSTRKGRVIALEGVLDEAELRVRALLEEKNCEIQGDEREELIRTIALGSVKFADLRSAREKNVVFRWDEMLSFDGFAAPYLQYTYARARSILRKNPAGSPEAPALTDSAERALALKLAGFAPAVLQAAADYHPHVIAGYVYSLAQEFNTFYQKVRIGDSAGSERATRLLLTTKTAEVISRGLGLLGIQVPERM